MRQSGEASERVSRLHARAVRTWKFGTLLSDSHVLRVWVLPCGYRSLDSLGDAFRGAHHLAPQWKHVMLQYTWLLDKFPTFSTSTWSWILRCFLRSHAEWRGVLSQCFWLRPMHALPALRNLEFLPASRGCQLA